MSDIQSNYHDGRLEGKCYFCEAGPPLHEHHIIPQRFGGPDSKDNVVALCHLCHKRIERLYDKSFYEWFGIEDEEGERKFHRPCEKRGCENGAVMKVERYRSPLANRAGNHVCPNPGKWGLDYSGLYCRPCTAKLSNAIFNRLWYLYRDHRSDIHYHARAGKNGTSTMQDPVAIAMRLERPPTREKIMEEIVAEEADEP